MDERRTIELLREWRQTLPASAQFAEKRQALDHAIATIERVADAPVGIVKEVCGYLVMLGELSEPYRATAHPVRLVPDPQPDGQEG